MKKNIFKWFSPHYSGMFLKCFAFGRCADIRSIISDFKGFLSRKIRDYGINPNQPGWYIEQANSIIAQIVMMLPSFYNRISILISGSKIM